MTECARHANSRSPRESLENRDSQRRTNLNTGPEVRKNIGISRYVYFHVMLLFVMVSDCLGFNKIKLFFTTQITMSSFSKLSSISMKENLIRTSFFRGLSLRFAKALKPDRTPSRIKIIRVFYELNAVVCLFPGTNLY